MKHFIFALAACCLFPCSSTWAQETTLANLLNDETVFVWSWSGEQATSQAYELTASHKAFHESGLVPAFTRLGESLPWTQLVAASGNDFPISWMQLKLAWNHVQAHGAALSIGLRGNDAESARPYGLLVLPEAGGFAPAIENLYRQLEQSEESVAGSIPQIDFSNINFPGIQLPFTANWQPLSGLSGQTLPSAYYLSDDVAYFPSSEPAPVSYPSGLPFQPAECKTCQKPDILSPPTQVKPWTPATPALPNSAPGGYAQAQPAISYPATSQPLQNSYSAPVGEIPRIVATTEPVEPLTAPKPALPQAPVASWKIEKTTIGDRSIYQLTGVVLPGFPDIQFAWWAEGGDLVFYYGLAPLSEHLESLQREENRLVKSELWQSSMTTANDDAEAGKLVETSRVWFNTERVAELYADMPIAGIEPATTVRKLIEPTGLLGLRAIGWRSGYRGQNLVSISRTVTESPRKGLLSLLDESTFTLDDLPPLPANVSAFTARAIDIGKTYHEAENLVEQYFKLGGAEGQLAWQIIKQQALGSNGFDLENDLLSHLGQVVVTYDDSEQEILGVGSSAIAIAVNDPDALLDGIIRWRDSVNESFQSNIRILRRERRGYTIFAIAGKNSFLSPSFALSGNWLVIGWQPQTVEAFQLRTAGKLPVWSPADLSEANRELLPQKFQHLKYSDPRSTVRTMVSLAPWALEGVRWYADQASQAGFVWNPGVSSLDIPPAELIVEPLYPNLTVTGLSDEVIHTEHWASTNVDNVGWLLGAYFGLGLLSK